MRNMRVLLIVGSVAVLSGWYVLAQEKSNRDSNSSRQNQGSNVSQADDRDAIQDAVRAMDSQGQLRLGGAIEIAERHAKGRAVRASVEISRVNRDNDDDDDRNNRDDRDNSRDRNDDGQVTRGSSNANPNRGEGINNQDRNDSAQNRTQNSQPDNESALIFEVLTYVDGNLHAVRIDAKSRRVISDETRRTLDPVNEDDDDNNDQGDDDRRDDDNDDDRDRNQNDNRRNQDDRDDRSDDQPQSNPDQGNQPNNPQPNNPQPTNPKDDNNEKPN